MHIVIVGAGAMGCLFAGMLARGGHDLLLLEKNPDRAHAIGASGIMIEKDGRFRRVASPAVSCRLPQNLLADVVLIVVKCYDTEKAVQDCLTAIGAATTVVTLQNGLGNVEVLERYVPQRQVLAGTTAQGATLLGHGRLRHAGRGDTVVGGIVPEAAGRAEAVRALFESCGIPTMVAADISSALWAKLLVNAGINALTAILDMPNGRVAGQEQVHAIMGRAVREGAEVAAKLGIVLPDDPVARTQKVCRATAENISSMLQDIRAGRRTEIEGINGSISAWGRRLGVATPVNSLLTCLVKALEPGAGP